MRTLGLRSESVLSITAMLAAFSVACSETDAPPVTTMVPDSVSEVAYGFSNRITVDGVEHVNLEADSAYHYMDRDSWELFELTVRFRRPSGQIRSTLTAREGTYNWRTGDMEAREDVVAVTPDGRRLETCRLVFNEATEQISGPCAFVFTAPNERLEGNSFMADPDFRNVQATQPRGIVRDLERN